jgi:hypothetical protein
MTWFECIVVFFAGYGASSLLFSLIEIASSMVRR